MFAAASKIVPRAMANSQIQVVRNANVMATAPRVRIPIAVSLSLKIYVFFLFQRHFISLLIIHR